MDIQKLNVFTSFSGYDSQCMALDLLNINYDLVGWSEIDKYAIKAHNAVYPEYSDRNLGDISKIEWTDVDDFDLFTYSFPCTDISSVGTRSGFARGANKRSSLLWELEKAIDIKRPSVCVMENVRAICSDKNRKNFLEWLNILESYGYYNTVLSLNSLDFGVPQNRPRVFVVSIKSPMNSIIPKKGMLLKRIGDILEPTVGDKYFLKEGMLKFFEKRNYSPNGVFKVKIKKRDDTAFCITCKAGNRTTDNFIFDNGKLRRLTPKECFRLMGVSDENIDKLCNVGISDTQLYKLAGNSIVVQVLAAIFKSIYWVK